MSNSRLLKEVYIVSAHRTAIAKGYKGSLAKTRSDQFCAELIKKLLAKNPSLDPSLIEDVIIGCAMPEAEQGMNTARFIALLAGLGEHVPGMTVNRLCSSGLQSIAIACDRIATGGSECILAGGLESMSMVPMMGNKPRGSKMISDLYPSLYMSMGLTAEKVAEVYKISRADQDSFALKSHQKALDAIKNDLFKEEIIPLTVTSNFMAKDPLKAGHIESKNFSFEVDEGPRKDSSLEALSKLRSVFKVKGTVTAGNSSQVSDGAAMTLVCSKDFVQKHNLVPMARWLGFAVSGVNPDIMGIGPVKAIPKALSMAGLKTQDIERIELNEAFAAQSQAVINELDLNDSLINPTGGAIALGHPLGATGAKLTATLLHGMKRDGQKYGMVTMCIGSGMGAAGIFESLHY